jgi:uncharacterized protein
VSRGAGRAAARPEPGAGRAAGRRKVAVIGGGVAGLTAGYVLRTCCDVTLFESEPRLGGHAHTHRVSAPDGGAHAIDTGFIVCNARTYPLLTRLLGELRVATQPTEMSLSVRCDGCGLEYAGGRGITGLAARRRSAADRRYLRMLAEAPRFYRAARLVLAAAGGADQTLGQFLSARGFSAYFREHFAAPLVATVWSCPPRLAMEYPARYLFAFLANHGLLSARRRLSWQTVSGGSASYVDRIARELTCVRTGSAVRSVRRTADGVEVRSDRPEAFDAAVIATHADQALSLLAEPTQAERALLGAFGYSRNRVLLHSDPGLLPRCRGARASWNYYQGQCAGTGPVRVSYDMNRLQRLATRHRYLVSVNPGADLPEDTVAARMVYEHPVYTAASVRAQRRLAELNDGRLAYAGAYHGWGFHEDGCRAGVAAALSLGATW